MAEATGNFSAYRQLTPLKGSVADDMNYQDQAGFQRRAEQRSIQEQEQKKQEAKEKKRADVLAKINAQQLYDTGSATWNERLHEGLRSAYNKWDDIIPILTNPEKYSDKEVIKANLVADNLNSFVDQVSSMDKITREFAAAAREDVAKGKKWANPEFEKKFSGSFNNKAIGVNELGEAVVYFIDEDGDGLDDNTGKPGKVGDYMSYSEVLDGTGLTKYTFEDRFNYESVLDDLSKKLTPVKNDTITGNLKTTKTGLDEDALENRVNSTLYNVDGTPSAIMKSFAKEQGFDLNNPEQAQKIKENLKQALRLKAKGGTELDYITPPIEFEKLKDARAKEQKNKPQRTTVTIKEDVRDEFAQNAAPGKDKVYPNAISVTIGSNGVPFKNIGGASTGLNSGYVTTITKDKKTGNLVFIGKALKTKNAKFKMNGQVYKFEDVNDLALKGDQEAINMLDQYSKGDNYGTFFRVMTEKSAAPIIMQAGYGSIEEVKTELDQMNQEAVPAKPKIKEENKKLGSKYN